MATAAHLRHSDRRSGAMITSHRIDHAKISCMAGTDIVVTRTLRIPNDELQWRFTGSGGPGGQHANTANTRVELIWDIAASAAPGPRQRALLLERLGPTLRVVA